MAAACAVASPAAAHSTLTTRAGVVTITADPGSGDVLAITKTSAVNTRFSLTGTTFREVNADSGELRRSIPRERP